MAMICVHGAKECTGCGMCNDIDNIPFFDCYECGEPLYEGDKYYIIDHEKYCQKCMQEKIMHKCGE